MLAIIQHLFATVMYSLDLGVPRRTVELRPSIEISWVRSENRPARLVGNSHHLIVNSLKVEICHDDGPMEQVIMFWKAGLMSEQGTRYELLGQCFFF